MQRAVARRLSAAGAAPAEPRPFADLEARWRKDLGVNALDAKTQLDLVAAVLGQMAPLSIEKSQLLAQANQLRTSLASATAATDVKDTTKQLLLLSTKTVQTAKTEQELAEATPMRAWAIAKAFELDYPGAGDMLRQAMDMKALIVVAEVTSEASCRWMPLCWR